MPAFSRKLSDAQVAAASSIRNAWGNAAAPLSAEAVHAARERLQ